MARVFLIIKLESACVVVTTIRACMPLRGMKFNCSSDDCVAHIPVKFACPKQSKLMSAMCAAGYWLGSC